MFHIPYDIEEICHMEYELWPGSVKPGLIGQPALASLATGQRVRRVEIRSFVHAHTQALDQFSTQPAAYEHQPRANQRKHYWQRSGIEWPWPTRQPTCCEQKHYRDVTQ